VYAQIQGTLDQGRGQLLVYEDTQPDKTFEYGLDVITNMGLVVNSLFRRAEGLMR
jgi:26S proteasome regulatory subunit N6